MCVCVCVCVHEAEGAGEHTHAFNIGMCTKPQGTTERREGSSAVECFKRKPFQSRARVPRKFNSTSEYSRNCWANVLNTNFQDSRWRRGDGERSYS